MLAKTWILGAAALLAVGFVPPSAVAVANGAVTVIDFAFVPPAITLTLDLNNGNKVTFANTGVHTHRPHAGMHGAPGEGLCFDSGNMAPGTTATVTLNPACSLALGVAGIQYHCHVHPNMLGTIKVLPA